MKTALKIFGWTLLSLVAIVLIVACVAIYIVFTPARMTPIVRDIVPQFVTCEASIDEADLTFFSTFPQFGVRVKNVCLKNPMDGAPSDTLAHINLLTATVDVWTFLTESAVILDDVYLDGGYANIYIDPEGNANYDIVVPSDTPEDTTSTELPFDILKVNLVKISNLRASYIDESSHIRASIDDVNLGLVGRLAEEESTAQTHLIIKGVTAILDDSTPLAVALPELDLRAQANLIDNEAFGDVSLDVSDIDFALGGDTLLRRSDISLTLPFKANLNTLYAQLDKARVALEQHEITLNGWAQIDDDIALDIDFESGEWDIEKVVALIPDAYADVLNGIDAKGNLNLKGKACGIYNDNTMPVITADLSLTKGQIAVDGVPYKLHDVSTRIAANLDLNKNGISSAAIKTLAAKTGSCTLNANGKIDDLLGNIRCDLHVLSDIGLPELKPLLPEDMNVGIDGRAKADLTARFALDDALNLNLEKIHANGTLIFSDLDVAYNDSIFAQSPELTLAIQMPSTKRNRDFKEALQVDIATPALKMEMTGMLDANLTNTHLAIATSNPLDTTRMPSAKCAFEMGHLTARMDTIMADVTAPSGSITLSPSRRNQKKPRLQCTYSSESLVASMGSAFNIDTKYLSISASTTYDEAQENAYLKWNPTLKIDFNDGNIRMASVEPTIQVPAIKFAFNPRECRIDDSRIIIDRSDFKLTGEAKNIRKFVQRKGNLEGEFNFISEQTDINQLLDLVSGFGSSDSTATAAATPEATDQTRSADDSEPFMVPRGVDIALNTNIHNAVFADNHLQDIQGKITVKDGALVLEQVGFTCDAAEMQLTAMYRSERRNHLFAGLDFHLLNIDIAQLIHMVPDIDTIFPMLKSFEGRAQFHLAAETYLKSNYDLKISTLRGAAAIEGKDLVLLDSEMFARIAKPLMFNRKTRNLIDSISVEATVFRDEVDLYPFVVSLDKYSAVVGGRYDLGNNYNAHIETLAPVRLALEVKGNASDLDNMKFNLVKTKYSDLYKPEKRNATEERTMALKKMISDALKSNVK